MNITISSYKKCNSIDRDRTSTKSGINLTLSNHSKLSWSSKLESSVKPNRIFQSSKLNEEDSDSILGDCCKGFNNQRIETQTDMPKKYENNKPKKSLLINTQVNTTQNEVYPLNIKQVSKRGDVRTWWNPDSPVNKLY